MDRDKLANRAIEQKTLSYLLEYPEVTEDYIPKLDSKDFYYFGSTYVLFDKLFNSEEETLDSATIYTRGNDSKIDDIMRTEVNPTEINSLFNNLKDLSNRRKLFRFTKQVEGAIDSQESVKERVVDLEKKFSDLTEGFYQTDSLQNTEELIPSVKEHLRELHESDGLTGIPTGLTDLDSQLHGYQDNDFVLIAARTSIGKTDFLLNSVLAAARESYKVAFFSLEMSANQILERMASQVSGVHRQKIMRGVYNENEKKKITSSLNLIKKMPISIDNSSTRINDISYKIQRQVNKEDLDIAFIDYFGLISMPSVQGGNTQNQKEQASHKLKFLARDLDIPIVVLSQINREVENKKSKRPSISNLRGTGALEQDSDVTILLNRPGFYEETDSDNIKHTDVIVGKQRNGLTGSLEATYEPETGKFNDTIK